MKPELENSKIGIRTPRLGRRLRVGVALRGSARGFTLIELILAVGIMAIVLIAINSVFFTSMRLHESTNEVVDEALPIQQALGTMRRDFQSAIPPSESGILTGDFKVGNVSSTTGQPVDVELYTTTGVMRENEPWSETQKVTYALRNPMNVMSPGRDLVRSVTRNLLATTQLAPGDEQLLSGVQSVQYECYDGATWNNAWDSTVTTNLPTAVRIKIILATAGGGTGRPLEIVVPIDSQSRTNQMM